jgi:hypothetical protein
VDRTPDYPNEMVAERLEFQGGLRNIPRFAVP